MAELGQIYLPEIDEATRALVREAEQDLRDVFAAIEERELINTRRVLASLKAKEGGLRHVGDSVQADALLKIQEQIAQRYC